MTQIGALSRRARRRHVRAFDYDVVVIGSGSGGSAQVRSLKLIRASWNEGAARQAILAYVNDITDKTSPEYVAPAFGQSERRKGPERQFAARQNQQAHPAANEIASNGWFGLLLLIYRACATPYPIPGAETPSSRARSWFLESSNDDEGGYRDRKSYHASCICSSTLVGKISVDFVSRPVGHALASTLHGNRDRLFH